VFSQAIVEMITSGRAVVSSVKDLVDGLPDSRLKRQLQSMQAVARDDLVEFRNSVERWFDSQMARVSAIYRSHVRIIVTVLGAVVPLCQADVRHLL
jgi:outer membrane protein assembly factor BamD (BamD/ComL family)